MQKLMFSPLVERLEERRLFAMLGDYSYTLLNNNTQLKVYGTAEDDDIAISFDQATNKTTLKVFNPTMSGSMSKTFAETTITTYDVQARENGSAGDKLTIDKLLSYPIGTGVERFNVIAKPLDYPDRPQDAKYRRPLTNWYLEQHQKIGQENPGVDTWFFGDSFAENFAATSNGANVNADWSYWSSRSLDLGVGGDTTSNMIWRINSSGYFDAIYKRPKQIFVMAGTNNITGVLLPQTGTNAQIAAGIEGVVTALRGKLTGRFGADAAALTKIVVLSLTPQEPICYNSRIMAVNDILTSHQSATAAGTGFRFANIYDTLAPSNNIGVRSQYYVTGESPHVHLSSAGYHEVQLEILAAL